MPCLFPRHRRVRPNAQLRAIAATWTATVWTIGPAALMQVKFHGAEARTYAVMMAKMMANDAAAAANRAGRRVGS